MHVNSIQNMFYIYTHTLQLGCKLHTPNVYMQNQKMIDLCASALHSSKNIIKCITIHKKIPTLNSNLILNAFLTSPLDCKAQSVTFTLA